MTLILERVCKACYDIESISVDSACVPCCVGAFFFGSGNPLTREDTVGRDRNSVQLYSVAQDMMDRTRAMERIANGLPVEGKAFRAAFLGSVQNFLRTWHAETLGAIAALGHGVIQDVASTHATLFEVGLGTSFNRRMNGRMVLRTLAGLTIVAAMLDLARTNMKTQGAGAKTNRDP